MTGSREEERRKLADIINHWNANRLDLFEISRPTEVGGRPGGRGGRGAAGPLRLLTHRLEQLLWAAWFSGFTGWEVLEVRCMERTRPDSIDKSGDLLIQTRCNTGPLSFKTKMVSRRVGVFLTNRHLVPGKKS